MTGTPRPSELRPSPAALALALAIGAALLVPWLGTVPGLHGDEAWAGVRAHEIAFGARPLMGMTPYAGPLYHYLVAPLTAWFGASVAVLRSLTVVTSLLTVVLYAAIVARLFGRRLAAFAALALVALPFFTAYGRMGAENFALNPLLAMLTVWLVLRGTVGAAAVAGLCLAAGTWNHLIFAPLGVALAAVAVIRHRLAVWRQATVWAVGLGYGIGMVPPLLVAWRWSQTQATVVDHRAAASFFDRLAGRAADWPALFLQVAHGDILFRRFAGELVLPTPNLTALVAAAGVAAVVVLAARRRIAWRPLAELAVFAVTLFVVTLVICTGNGDRYFLLPLYLVPIPIAAAFVALGRTRAARAVPLLFAAFLSFEVARTGVNFLAAQVRSGGRPSVLYLGRQAETSNHFVRTDGLYRDLVAHGARRIAGDFFIVLPLQFHDLEAHRFESVVFERMPDPPREGGYPAGTVWVEYAEGAGPGRYAWLERLVVGGTFAVGRFTSPAPPGSR